jgi:TonB-linked SusC/RagA family outer membrane protein
MKIQIYKYIIPVFFLITSNLFAQEASKANVSGVVTDVSSGETLIGATVLEKGTNNGVATDLSGGFTISVSPKATLVISYIGYATQEVKYTGQKNLQIRLGEDAKALDEVVVTALGIKKQAKALGYAVAEVKSDEITAGRETNAITSLSGKLAGVDISTTSGGPSGSTRVVIRGNSQLTGSNMPLFVIDGLPMDNTQLGAAGKWGGYDMGDGLSGINPDDIESISVLKGSSASALYGSRASNGVVLITTKSGKDKKGFGVEFSTNANAVSILSHFDDYQRVYGQGSGGQPPLVKENAQSNTQSAWGAQLDPNISTLIYNGEEKPYGNINNNVMSFFRTGWTFTNTLALSTGNESSNFRLSFSDMRNTDIVPQSDMRRTTVMLKGGATFAKKLHAEARINYTTEGVNNRPALSDSPNNIGNALIGLAPNFDQKWLSNNYKDEFGRYNSWNGNPWRLNPYWVLNEMENKSQKDRFMGQVQISYDILPFLSARVKAGTDYYNFHFIDFAPRYTDGLETGRMQDLSTTVFENNYEAMLQFNKRFFDDVLDVSAFAGGNIMQYQGETYNLTGQNEVIPGIKDITNYNPLERGVDHSLNRKQINSLFGAVNFGYKSFLYLDMTFRNDVSSTLAKGYRSYFYPSVSGSFILSEIVDLKPANISFAKLRASWAKVGGDTDPYRLDLTYSIAPYSVGGKTLGMVSSSVLPNKYLKPTSTYSKEVGVDVRFFNNRLNFDLGYYHQSAVDQIMLLPLTSSTLYSHATINAGEIVNKGFELATSVIPARTRNFEWGVNINLARNINEIVSLHPDVKDYMLAEARWANASIYATEGEAYGTIVGKKFKRNESGDIIFQNGMPTFDEKVSILGNGNYKFTMGFGNNIRYKNIALSMLFDMKFGADIYSMTAWATHANGTSTNTLPGRKEWYTSEEARRAENMTLNQWTPTGGFIGKGVVNVGTDDNPVWEENTTPVDPQAYWRTVSENTPEPFICDASYIKLRELTLSWSLPKNLLAKTFLQEVSFTAYARNLWILYTQLKNVDPESNYNNGNGQGFEYGSLPSRRTYGFGINIKF